MVVNDANDDFNDDDNDFSFVVIVIDILTIFVDSYC